MLPTPEQIFDQVQKERPKGWRRFTLAHARRVHKALASSSSVGTTVLDGRYFGGQPMGGLRMSDISHQEVLQYADRVRTNNGAVGIGFGTIIGYLAWKLVEAAVWWAIKWAWRKQWGLEEG